jgi:glycine/D-amino acid oxidase-like deaminating enzyme
MRDNRSNANDVPYPAYADPCGWNRMLPPRPAQASANGEITARYAIVGAGFAGLAAARRLSELDPGAAIVMLEATMVGEGSSARNSGFLSPGDIATGLGPSDIEQNAATNRASAEGFDWLQALIARYDIACDLHRSGRIKAAATANGVRSIHAFREIVQKLNIPHVLLDRDQLQERIGSRYYRCGLFTEEGYLVQPAALVRGLADALPTNVRLFEQSPVRDLRRDGKWRLWTPDARITADYVILAVNAAVKNFGYLRDRLVTIFTYAAITQPLPPDAITRLGTMASWGLLSTHRLGTTVRRVGIDRLMVRSLYSYERGLSSQVARAALLARFRRRYPDLADVDLDDAWGGTTALTMNGSPFWGRLDDRLYACAGCNGAGLVKGTVLGKRLAELISGHDVVADTARSYGSPSWIAPEPFRSVGFRVVSAIERRKAGLES